MDQELGALGSAFPPVTAETWRKVVEKALGGKSADSLSSVTDDGLTLKPLYLRSDWAAGRSGAPGAAPFTRGATRAEGWDIRPVIDDPRLPEAKAAIKAELAGGASSLALRLAEPAQPKGPWGVFATTLEDLDTLLQDVLLQHIAIAFDAGPQGYAAAVALIALWKRRGIAPKDAMAALNIDPIGAGVGGLENEAIGALAKEIAAHYPQVTTLGVDLRVYHAAGASEAQEIGLALATGAAYLRMLEAAGLSLEAALGQIRFIFATDSLFFLSIAKLRAARLAWSRLVEACGVDPAKGPMRIWAETAWQELARRDPYVNMLRGSAGCFAAAVGGAEAISVRPFDEAITVPGPFGRRIARNTQLVLAEEAGLARVQDPAGGSWYVESATEKLAEAGWRIFHDIEAAGGIWTALSSGKVASLIGAIDQRRSRRLATREEPLTGVSIYPDLNEPLVSAAEIDWAKVAQEAKARVKAAPNLDALKNAPPAERLGAAIAALEAGASLSAIETAVGHHVFAHQPAPRRLAEPFEALRDACDALPRRPKLFLANWGKPRDYLDSATFARNLFAVGGIEAVGDQGYADKDALLKAARESGASLIVLCTGAEKRAAEGADLIAALRTLKPLRLYAVGAVAGADVALGEDADVVALLREALGLLGAKLS